MTLVVGIGILQPIDYCGLVNPMRFMAMTIVI